MYLNEKNMFLNNLIYVDINLLVKLNLFVKMILQTEHRSATANKNMTIFTTNFPTYCNIGPTPAVYFSII